MKRLLIGLIVVVLSVAPAFAQEISGNFSGGSVKIGADTGTCDAGRAGAIRYNGTILQFCNGSAWGSIGSGSAGVSCITRSTVLNASSAQVSCVAGERVTGGGCGSVSQNIIGSNPFNTDTWRCAWSNPSASNTVYAVCCLT